MTSKSKLPSDNTTSNVVNTDNNSSDIVKDIVIKKTKEDTKSPKPKPPTTNRDSDPKDDKNSQNNNLTSLENMCNELFKSSEKTGDVVILTKDNKSIKAHRFIIELNADYFKQLFSREINNAIDMTKYSFEVVNLLLKYMYTRQMDHFNADCNNLLDVSNMYILLDLTIKLSFKQYSYILLGDIISSINLKTEYIFRFTLPDIGDDMKRKIIEKFDNLCKKNPVKYITLRTQDYINFNGMPEKNDFLEFKKSFVQEKLRELTKYKSLDINFIDKGIFLCEIKDTESKIHLYMPDSKEDQRNFDKIKCYYEEKPGCYFPVRKFYNIGNNSGFCSANISNGITCNILKGTDTSKNVTLIFKFPAFVLFGCE